MSSDNGKSKDLHSTIIDCQQQFNKEQPFFKKSVGNSNLGRMA